MRALVTSLVLASVLANTTGCSSPSSGTTAVGTSSVVPPPSSSAIREELIPGIGAKRANWDATHTLNAANDKDSDYGHDPSLPPYVTDNGAVYRDVSDLGTERVQAYTLALHTTDAQEVLRQIRRELPSDATIAWDLTRDQCYRVAFNSPALEAAAGRYMVEAELQYLQPDGTAATSPDRFNFASFWLDEAGSPPDPEKGC